LLEGSGLESPKYKRIVLKLSGEALAGAKGYGIDHDILSSIARQVVEVVNKGVQVGIVVGGGNIWRGVAGSAQGMDRATADYMDAGYSYKCPGPAGCFGEGEHGDQGYVSYRDEGDS